MSGPVCKYKCKNGIRSKIEIVNLRVKFVFKFAFVVDDVLLPIDFVVVD